MEPGSVVKSIYDFKSDVEGELELHVGDVIQVIERVDRHWLRGTCCGRTGNFPSGFVVEVKVPQFEDGQALFAAINTFVEQETGDLSFDRGDLIVGIEAIDQNWWRGKVGGKIGIFPITHVWALDTLSVKKSSYPKRVSMIGRVKMDMKAQLSEEIDLKQGDNVLISEIVDKDWFRGTCNGQTGLIPSAFVIIIDQGELNQNQISNLNVTKMESIDLLKPNQSQEESVKSHQNTPQIDVTQPSPPIKASDNSWLQACNESNNNHYGYDSLNSGITPYGRTLTSFRGEFPNELSFGIGELVRLMRHVDDYWLEGEIDGKIGLFPRKCIDVIVDCPEALANSSNDKGNLRQVVLPNDTFGRVLFEFLAEVEGDLPLKEGDTITLLRKINDNWYEAVSDDGKMGLCPANFVEIIGSTRERSGSGSSVASDWRGSNFRNASGSSLDQALKLDLSSESGSSLPRSMSISESSSYSYDNSFNSLDGTGVRQKPRPTLRTQTSLPTLPSSDLFNDSFPDVRSKNSFSKSLNSRRSAPAAPLRFPDIVEDTGTFAESSVSKSSSLNLSQFEIEKEISEKSQQKERYERCRDKLRHQVERETDGSSPGALEFKREIAQYDRQIQSLETEIAGLKSQLRRDSNEASGSGHFKTEEDKQKEALVEMKRKEEDARKARELKRKNMDQRQCIITELLQTERDYLQDLKICQSIFLSVPEEGKTLGIDMVTVFGNLDEVIDVASRLLRHVTKCCLDKAAEEQIVGECFVNLGEDLKEVYGHYCRNHDEVIPLLKKYEANQSIQEFIYRGVERMKSKTNCFDLQSVLIKPVQRILKYPLLLNELLKCTEDGHADKANLVKAVDIMAEVAMAINEFKRRKDLVFKYRKDTDTSLSSRFSKLTLHSLRKKSSRFSVMLSSSLGLSSVTKDEDFLEAEKKFQTVEKTLKIFLKDLTSFTAQMQEFYAVILNVAEDIGSFYQERKGLKEVDQLRSVHRIIFTQFWEDFKTSVDKRVFGVVKQVLQMFHGPHNLIQKRHDKLLDYDAYESKLKSTKDANKARALQEEVQLAKNTYEALNTQLLDELPQLCSLSIEILHDCIVQFLHARRVFIGRSAKEMLNLMELPALAGMQSDIMEVFKVKHNLVVDALVQMSVIPKHLFPSAVKVDGRKQSQTASSRSSIGSGNLNVAQKHVPQSPGQKAYLKSQYPPQSVFVVNEEYVASDFLDVSLTKGDIVGVIKKKDPMDNSQRWFVDNGVGKGFVPCRVLSALTSNAPMAPSRLSYPPPPQIKSRGSTPSPDVTRYCNLPTNDPLQQTEKNSSGEYSSSTNWNLLNVSVGSKTPSSGQASPRYSEVDEFDPLSGSNANLSYEEVPNLDHRYETMPGEETSTYGEMSPLRSSSPKSVYENVSGEQGKDTRYYYAKYAFSAGGSNQLSMAQGQVVLLINGCDLHGNSEWCFVEDRYGNKGFVPTLYLAEYDFNSTCKITANND